MLAASLEMDALFPSPRLRRGGVRGGGCLMRKPSVVDTRIPRARTLRRDMTDAEKKLWQHLRQPPFKQHHFRRQATIGPYFCDFASHTLRLAIELDGGQHADNAADDRRTAFLSSRGYRVVRFWNNDVLKNVPGVLSSIGAAVHHTTPPTPDPSPPQAGGGRRAERAELPCLIFCLKSSPRKFPRACRRRRPTICAAWSPTSSWPKVSSMKAPRRLRRRAVWRSPCTAFPRVSPI